MNKITIFFFLLIFLPNAGFGVEGMDVDITYPLTPPEKLFKGMEEWRYARTPFPSFFPIFDLNGETNRKLDYNTEITAGFVYLNTRQTIKAGRKGLSIYDSTKTDYIKSSIYYKKDSLSIGYRNSSWFDLRKELLSFDSYLITEGKDYIGEIEINSNHFEKRNDYSLSSSVHRFYDYANMLSIGFMYSYSAFLIDREKVFQIKGGNRFAYEDYLFIIPGAKAEFISQTLFTPFLQTIYLVNKNVSLSVEVEGKSSETNLKSLYNFPYIVFPESLKTPLNLIKASFEMKTVVDTSLVMKLNICARKTRKSIFATEKGSHLLSFENMDTTITFTTLLFYFKISRWIFSVNSNLSLGYTPFYKEKIPYFPRYQLSTNITLHPLKPLSFINNIEYVGGVYDSNGREIDAYYIYSPTLELRIMKNASLNVGVLNVADCKERFIADVYFPGRIIKSGINVFF
ncbi:MAG: hypothetical protein E3J87_07995 [Candidatus Cloacimonadota bacterium]|nr:MAG: hypothetical protein E3J87_07995 [Candidatus Cloacimonadota bacterium]